MTTPSFFFVAPLLLLIALPAQVQVSPRHFLAAEGNSASSGVGEIAAMSRYLQVHGDFPTQTFKSLAFRRDGESNHLGTMAATSMVCSIFLSTAAKTPGNIVAKFDDNHGANKVTVAAFTPYKLPATSPAAAPQSWSYRFPFKTPFAYAGGKGLCWEMRVHTRTNKRAILLDAVSNWSPNPPLVVLAMGAGCKASGWSTPMSLRGGSTGQWGQQMTFSWTGASLPRSGRVLLSFGMNNKTLGPFQLPLLLPGTSGFRSGPCYLHAESLLSLPVGTSATGALATKFSATLRGWHHGGSIFTQAIAMDKAANGLGIASSNLVQHHLVGPFSTVQLGHVALSGSLGPVGTSGTWSGLVTRVD